MALLNDPDTYLHIAAGGWMLAYAALPLPDPFSHSVAADHSARSGGGSGSDRPTPAQSCRK